MLRAYGSLQGWDGVFEYTYNHRTGFQPERQTYFFSMINRTDVLAHFPACAAIYLRGDVQEAKKSVVAAVDYPTYFDRLAGSKAVGSEYQLARVRLPPDAPPQNVRRSLREERGGPRKRRAYCRRPEGVCQRHGRTDVEHAGARRRLLHRQHAKQPSSSPASRRGERSIWAKSASPSARRG